MATNNTKLAAAAARAFARAEGHLRGLRFRLAESLSDPTPSDALKMLAGEERKEISDLQWAIKRLEGELPELAERHACYADPLPAWLDRVRVLAWGPSPLPNSYRYPGPRRECGVTVELLPARDGGEKWEFAGAEAVIETPKRPYGRGDCTETYLAAVGGGAGRQMARAIRGEWLSKKPLERRRVVADLLEVLGVKVGKRGPRPSKEEV